MDELSDKPIVTEGWRDRVRVIKAFFSRDRLVAAGALLLIPCMLFTWVRIPIGGFAGLSIAFSVPVLVSTSLKAVDRVDSLIEVSADIEQVINRTAHVLERGSAVLDGLSSSRDSGPETYSSPEEEA